MNKSITGYWDDARNDINIPSGVRDLLLPYPKSELIHDQLADIWGALAKKYRFGRSYDKLKEKLKTAFDQHADEYAKAVTQYVAVCEKYGSIDAALRSCPAKKRKEYKAVYKRFRDAPLVRVREDLGIPKALMRLATDLAVGPPYRFGEKTIKAGVQEACLLLIGSDHEASLGNVNSAAFIQHEARQALAELLTIHENNYFAEQHSSLKANGGHAKAAELQEVKNEVIRLLHDLRPEQGWKSMREAAAAMSDKLPGELGDNGLSRKTQYGPITKFQREQGITAGLSSFGMKDTLADWMGAGKNADAKVHEAFEATKKASKA